MASVPYRGRPASPPTGRKKIGGERGRVGGESADGGNNFQRMSWRGKKKKNWKITRAFRLNPPDRTTLRPGMAFVRECEHRLLITEGE